MIFSKILVFLHLKKKQGFTEALKNKERELKQGREKVDKPFQREANREQEKLETLSNVDKELSETEKKISREIESMKTLIGVCRFCPTRFLYSIFHKRKKEKK